MKLTDKEKENLSITVASGLEKYGKSKKELASFFDISPYQLGQKIKNRKWKPADKSHIEKYFKQLKNE